MFRESRGNINTVKPQSVNLKRETEAMKEPNAMSRMGNHEKFMDGLNRCDTAEQPRIFHQKLGSSEGNGTASLHCGKGSVNIHPLKSPLKLR